MTNGGCESLPALPFPCPLVSKEHLRDRTLSLFSLHVITLEEKLQAKGRDRTRLNNDVSVSELFYNVHSFCAKASCRACSLQNACCFKRMI